MNNNVITSGRRKTSIASVYLKKGNGNITVNGKDYKKYFSVKLLQYTAKQSLLITNTEYMFNIIAKLKGGGIKGQAEALRLAISKALLQKDPNLKINLRKNGMLTRDSRVIERKKYGHKKSRKQFQFSKR